MATLLLGNIIKHANPFWGVVLSLVASTADQYLFGKQQSVSRMDSTQVNDSSYGNMIPIVFGMVRTSGNIIFATSFKSHKQSSSSGKGGGSGTTTYTYSISLGVAICKGPIVKVRRLWMSGTQYILTSVSGTTYTFTKVNDTDTTVSCRIYLGTEDQEPDSYMETKNGGAGTTPGYRGLAYAVFQDLYLTDFGNGVPQIQFEVVSEKMVDSANYSGQTVSGKTFTDEDLSFSFWENATIKYCTFTNCRLDGSNWSNSTIKGCTFPGCSIRESTWASATIDDCNFDGADARGSSWTSAEITDSSFDSADVRGCGTMNVGNCTFISALVNNTSFQLISACTFTSADYDTTDPGYLSYYPSCLLSKIISTLAGYAEITDDMLVMTGISNSVSGYIITSQATFRSMIETFMQAYAFDAYEADGVLNCTAQTSQTTIVIPESDLGAKAPDGETVDKLKIVDTDTYELPPQINVTYYNYAGDYRQGTVRSRRMYYTEALGEETINLPIVMTEAEAQTMADNLLIRAWTNKTTYTAQVGNKWAMLRPANILQTTVNGIKRVWQITKIDYDGGIVKLEGKGFKTPSILSHEIVDPTVNMITPGAISFYLLDIPLLTSTDGPGFYGAATAPSNYKSVMLYKATTGDATTFKYLDEFDAQATAGTADTVLADGPVHFFDNINTVDVTLVYGTLESVLEIDALNWNNVALLGDEIIQFKTAILIAENQYRLSGLLRGRRGTEWATGAHVTGEEFVLLSSDAIQEETLNLSDIGREITYKYGYANTDGTEEQFTATGKGYKPYSVCHVASSRDSSGNLTITWIRRTRIGGEWQDNIDALLSETTEAYEIDIMSGTTVKRTLTASTGSVDYTAAQQVTDFGSMQSSVMVNIYQISDKVGRGYVKEVIL